ncbi:GTP-binding protein [Cyanobium sp. Aljojuca 7D2]|uniref:GTP-binding protein n=1 Tax=Cyanobium sp. Aljojuca 7D2 TaxID=2823698 RepID=UPI0020CF6110|nr:GTP-binding protein [Cyanobium sp. Aljojuca 7D2]MCP9891313.1 GTP-binding protein [Cyanobium sp. Aljojuca 7D2]
MRPTAGETPVPATPERCQQLLDQWSRQLQLSGREQNQLAGQRQALDRQLERLRQRCLRVAVFGRVGVGKSSLLNALLGEVAFATDVAHGCTRHQAARAWDQPIEGLQRVELVDTPGIDEIAAAARARLAARVALGADLVLLVLDGDLTSVEHDALAPLLASGKPLLLVLNRCDCWSAAEQAELIASIQRRLPAAALHLELIPVAAAPRLPQLLADGRVRSIPQPPRVAPLRQALVQLLEQHGPLLLALNALGAADRFHQALQRWRLGASRQAAQSLIGRFAALKATGVAANPLVLLDLAGGLACDTALVLQLCQLYGLPMHGAGARQLLRRLSGHNALLGGAQLGIQLLLGALRQLLLVAAPLTGGLSLAPAAPVALAQAALAVHTTRLTGRLAAAELLRSAQRGGRPGALLRRLARTDPQVRLWLGDRPEPPANLQALLP